MISRTFIAISLLAFFLGASQGDVPKPGKGEVVAKCVDTIGVLLHREPNGKQWGAIKAKEDIRSGDLLLSLPGTTIDSKNGAVRLLFMPDLTDHAPIPVRETVIVLNENPAVDLDFKLERGRVNLLNVKKEGAATVQVHFRGQVWNVSLTEPGTLATVELYSRWARGQKFTKKPTPDDVPAVKVLLIALKGRTELTVGGKKMALHPPPDAAQYQWDNTDGNARTPIKLEKLPAWADPDREVPAELKKTREAIENICKKLAEKPIEEVVREAYHSNDPNERRFAVHAFGAADNLAALVDALEDAKRPDVRDVAVLALRHWIGREPGHDLKLYNYLMKREYSQKHAEQVMNLLHSFDETETSRPELYELLIMGLNHPRIEVRHLAHWHLIRLAPIGKDIPYDAGAEEKERQQAIKAWQEKVPAGQMPPEPKSDPKP